MEAREETTFQAGFIFKHHFLEPHGLPYNNG